MSKRKSKEQKQAMYEQVLDMRKAIAPDEEEEDSSGHSSNKMKKFRFQLLHQWLVTETTPARVADIGGGKGLLSYLLRSSGWEATVIDPFYQELPNKYKDIRSNKRVNIPATAKIPRISEKFEPEMAADFDLLVGLHAHGCNIKIIDASADYGTGFCLLPCCVIDEPIYPKRGGTWVGLLTDYAIRLGFDVRPFRLAFSGQSIGIYALPQDLKSKEK
jgi:hypothetical protein